MVSIIETLESGAVELITSFAAGQAQIEASVTDNWQSFAGAFRASGEADVRLEHVVLVTSPDCVGAIRIYDISPVATGSRIVVQTNFSGSAYPANSVPLSKMSSRFKLYGGKTYLLQAKCNGPVDPSNFMFIASVTPKNG